MSVIEVKSPLSSYERPVDVRTMLQAKGLEKYADSLESEMLKQDVKYEQLLELSEERLDSALLHLGLLLGPRLVVTKGLVRARLLQEAKPISLGWSYKIPMVNVIIAVLSAEAIDEWASFEKAVNVIALLTGLMLSVVVGLPTSVSIDEITAFIEYWDTLALEYGDEFDQYERNFARSRTASFSKSCSLAYNFLCSSLFSIVILYFCSFTLTFTQRQLQEWWKVVRWIIIYSFGAMITGIAFAGDAMSGVIIIKSRNYHLERAGPSESGASIINFTFWTTLILQPIMLSLTFVIGSIALYRKDNVIAKK